jgi:NAD(P)-dependent dehydrogenase (short-subunit alcohol dehydrogenase family)
VYRREGAKVVVANRRVDKGEAAVAEIKNSGGEAIFVQTDVSKWEDVDRLVLKTVETYSKVDILINNAGIVRFGPLHQTDDQTWNDTININLKGVFYGMKRVIAEMLKQPKGKIVNIASIAGLVGFDQIGPYCASKGGIIALTREAALEYAKNKINVNVIAPGVIKTEMTEGMLADEATKKGFQNQTPYPRLGESEDIAQAALYLSSDEADFVTGEVLVVDGGWTIR